MSSLRWVSGQAFAPYTEWECFIAGFHSVKLNPEHAQKSCSLYQNIPALRLQCGRVLREWSVSSAVHISQNRNHRAWMGHAACFLHHGAGADSSIAAYWMLTDLGRDQANSCVMEAVNLWKQQNWAQLSSNANFQSASGQLEFPF